MENLNENTKAIYHLLTEHKLTIIGDINDYYKCGICKNILINAYQTICGENFCCKCIFKFIANGDSKCPCNINGCKLESSSDISINYDLNEQIAKLIIRCPNKFCSHECQIKKMEEHLEYCSNLKIKNSSNGFDLEQDYIIHEKLNDHMLSDIHNHNKLLIDLIENLIHEMRKINEKVEENRLEIELLKESDRRKDKIIESLKIEIKSIKEGNEDLAQQMEIGDRNLWNKFDKIDLEINRNLDRNVTMNIESCKMRKECNEKLTTEILNDNINNIDKFIKMKYNGILWWQIGKICQMTGGMRSEYFYDKQNPYKMRLGLRNFHDNFNIDFVLYSGCFDEILQWPCKAKISVDLSALNNFSKYKLLEKSCIISKPEINSPKCGDPIIISNSELKHSNLFNINCLLRCTVKFE